MQYVDDMLSTYNLDQVEAQVYVCRNIADSDAGEAEKKEFIP
jgi:hypothetical protein